MDQHAFRGSDGGKGVFSLWHPYDPAAPLHDIRCAVRDGMRCGFSSAVYDWLDEIGQTGKVEDAYSFILAVLSAPAYSAAYWEALEVDSLRVPLTKDVSTFFTGATLGRKLRKAWALQVPRTSSVAWGGPATSLALGSAKHTAGGLAFDNGRSLAGVSADAWSFEVSNYGVLRQWFEARSHWTATVSQAKSAIAVVSAVQEIVDLRQQMDALLLEATATA